MLGVPETPSPVFWEDLRDSAYGCVHGSDLLQHKETKQIIREKAPGFPEETRTTFQGSLSLESHKTPFIPPATSCDNTCETLPTREAHQRAGAWNFYRWLIMGQPLPGTCQDARLPEGEQVFGRNYIVLYKQFRLREPLLWVRVLGTLHRSQFPDTSQGPTLSAEPFKPPHLRPGADSLLHRHSKTHPSGQGSSLL